MKGLENTQKELEAQKQTNSQMITEKGKEVLKLDGEIGGEQGKLEEAKRKIQDFNFALKEAQDAKQRYEQAKEEGTVKPDEDPGFDQIIETIKKIFNLKNKKKQG